MLDNMFTVEIFVYCLIIFLPSFAIAVFFDNYLIRKIRRDFPDVYKVIKGNVDDTYLVEGETVRFIHGIRLDYVIFRGKYLKEIGEWKTATHILITIGWKLTLLYMLISVILIMSSVVTW